MVLIGDTHLQMVGFSIVFFFFLGGGGGNCLKTYIRKGSGKKKKSLKSSTNSPFSHSLEYSQF